MKLVTKVLGLDFPQQVRAELSGQVDKVLGRWRKRLQRVEVSIAPVDWNEATHRKVSCDLLMVSGHDSGPVRIRYQGRCHHTALQGALKRAQQVLMQRHTTQLPAAI